MNRERSVPLYFYFAGYSWTIGIDAWDGVYNNCSAAFGYQSVYQSSRDAALSRYLIAEASELGALRNKDEWRGRFTQFWAPDDRSYQKQFCYPVVRNETLGSRCVGDGPSLEGYSSTYVLSGFEWRMTKAYLEALNDLGDKNGRLAVCDNTCTRDDGNIEGVCSDTLYCKLGTDCEDCGPRLAHGETRWFTSLDKHLKSGEGIDGDYHLVPGVDRCGLTPVYVNREHSVPLYLWFHHYYWSVGPYHFYAMSTECAHSGGPGGYVSVFNGDSINSYLEWQSVTWKSLDHANETVEVVERFKGAAFPPDHACDLFVLMTIPLGPDRPHDGRNHGKKPSLPGFAFTGGGAAAEIVNPGPVLPGSCDSRVVCTCDGGLPAPQCGADDPPRCAACYPGRRLRHHSADWVSCDLPVYPDYIVLRNNPFQMTQSYLDNVEALKESTMMSESDRGSGQKHSDFHTVASNHISVGEELNGVYMRDANASYCPYM